jgi:hypothetical protein
MTREQAAGPCLRRRACRGRREGWVDLLVGRRNGHREHHHLCGRAVGPFGLAAEETTGRGGGLTDEAFERRSAWSISRKPSQAG